MGFCSLSATYTQVAFGKNPRNTLFWNLNYWDTASTLAGEVEDVKTTYPKALAIALVAVVLSYFLPLLGTLRVWWKGIGYTTRLDDYIEPEEINHGCYLASYGDWYIFCNPVV